MRSVSVRLADLENIKINLGYVGENEHVHILFDCKKAFDQYPNAVPSLVVVPPKGDSYPAVVTREGDIVEWVVTDSDLIYHGNGKIQLQFEQNDIVMKSAEARTFIAPSSIPTGTIPTPIQNWIAQANAILAEIPEDINSALAAAKASGEFDGDDGVGIASIAKTGTSGLVDTYTITLTNGSHYDIDVTNGTPGQNGVGIQNIAKTSTVGLVDTYTITLTNGQTYPFTVTNGQNGVEIDDTTPAVNKVFSSSKVDQELTDVKTAIDGKQDAPSTAGTSGQILSLDSNLDPVWVNPSTASIEDGSVTKQKLASDVVSELDSIQNTDDNLTDEKANVAQIANNGYQKFFPEWERGAWGLSGKEVNANSMRSKDLIYLPSGVYTVYSVDPMSVFTYYDTEAQDGGNPQWKQTGEQTITITTRNYVGFAVEWASTETGNPTGNYAIIPSAVSDVIAKANKTADDLAETNARTVFSDGTYNAVLQNVTVTENKGIGSGVLVGSVVSLTNDTYSQVMEVPVTAGRTYRMKARVYANYFIAHFTDSNNILIEKTGKNTTGATNTMVDFSAVAPVGATKLYIAGMKNTPILCDVFNPYTVKDIISMNENKARGAFCIMEFNVGDWYQGIYRDGDKTGIIPADETIYAQYMELFRDIFNRYKPDIALLNEEAQNMCMNRHDDSRAFLGEWWRYQYRGLFMSQDLSDVFNTIASCLPLSDITVRNFTDTESNMHRNYIKGYLYLNGKKICVICAHLSSNIDIAKLNATELLNDLQTEDPEYLICCGDFNYDTNVPEIAAFETAGYTISRGNVVYDGHTYGPGDLVVTTPNITVKSCFCDKQKIGNVSYIDHLPTVAYLEIF